MNSLPPNLLENKPAEKYKDKVEKLQEEIEKAEYELSKDRIKYLELMLTVAKQNESTQNNAIEVLEAEKVIMKKMLNNLEKKTKEYEEEIKKIGAVLAEEEAQKKEGMTKNTSAAKENETGKLQQYQEMIATLEKQKEQMMKKTADLEKERDSWKRTAEKAQDNAMALTLENDDLQQQLSVKDEKVEVQIIKWENVLEIERNSNRRLAERIQSTERANVDLLVKQEQLKEELVALKRDEALVSCKICYDRPVQNVFKCGHATCDVCLRQLQECHICRKGFGTNKIRKIYFT